MPADHVLDLDRESRIGLPEAVFCAGKSPAQIAAILETAEAQAGRILLTRLDPEKHAALPAEHRSWLDYDPISRTAFLGPLVPVANAGRVGVVAAGTSDAPIVEEALRTLRFHGEEAERHVDVGVAGLWRLLERRAALARLQVVIAVAGMEGALFSVLGGLVPGVVIAVPSAVGYGVGAGGHAALHAALASCAPGLVTVNIDNGYGAACAALRILNVTSR